MSKSSSEDESSDDNSHEDFIIRSLLDTVSSDDEYY